MHALSAAVALPLRSYYPPISTKEFLPTPFSRKVVGRGVKPATPAVTVM